MDKMRMTVKSDLKKYITLNNYTAEAYSTGGMIKHLSKKFPFSEFELKTAHKQGKIRIYLYC